MYIYIYTHINININMGPMRARSKNDGCVYGPKPKTTAASMGPF